jgi:hypothetical protein
MCRLPTERMIMSGDNREHQSAQSVLGSNVEVSPMLDYVSTTSR